MQKYAAVSNVIELSGTCCIVIKNNDPICAWMGRSLMWYKFCQRCSGPLWASKAWFMAASHPVIADRGFQTTHTEAEALSLRLFYVMEAEMLMIVLKNPKYEGKRLHFRKEAGIKNRFQEPQRATNWWKHGIFISFCLIRKGWVPGWVLFINLLPNSEAEITHTDV